MSDERAKLVAQLVEGCEQLGLSLSDTQTALLIDYIDLLLKWNGAYNLTAVRDPADMITRHLLDSLAIRPYLSEGCYLDVGTGAGLPGVPLSVVMPESEFHLLDSNGKKTRFLFQVKTALGLANMSVHHARVESFSENSNYDGVLSRAFASLDDMLCGCWHTLAPDGRFLAMKGAVPHDEIAGLDERFTVLAEHSLTVPGLNEERHLIEIVRARGAP